MLYLVIPPIYIVFNNNIINIYMDRQGIKKDRAAVAVIRSAVADRVAVRLCRAAVKA